jgi:hypothetical protein
MVTPLLRKRYYYATAIYKYQAMHAFKSVRQRGSKPKSVVAVQL